MAQFFNRFSQHGRRRDWLVTALLIFPAIATNSLSILRGIGTLRNTLILALAIPFILVANLFNRKQITGAAILLLYIEIVLFAVRQVFGLGLFSALVLTPIGIAIANYYFEPSNRRSVFIAIGVANLAILLLDIFGSLDRIIISTTGFIYISIYLIPVLIGIFAYLYWTFDRLPIFTKLVATISLLVVLSIGINIAFNAFNQRNFYADQVSQSLQTLAQFDANLVAQVLEEDISTLEEAGESIPVTTSLVLSNIKYSGVDAGEIATLQQEYRDLERTWPLLEDNHFLKRTVSNREEVEVLNTFRNSNIINIQLIDQLGKLVSATEVTDRYYYGDDLWWDGVTEFEPYVGDIRQTGEREFIYTAVFPVVEEGSNRFLGAVVADLRLSELEFLDPESTNIDSNTSINLIFSETSAVSKSVETNDEWVIETSALFPTFLDQIESFEASTVAFENENFIAAAVPISSIFDNETINNLNWTVLVYQAESQAFAPIRAQQSTFLGIGIIIILAALGFASTTANAIANPIRELEAQATRFAQGDLASRSNIESSDEIGSLSNAFNQMAQEIQSSLDNLEQTVEQRTQALQTTFRVSRTLTSVIDQQTLVQKVVEEIKSAFNYYHVHIYLVDPESKMLRMAQGSGEIGKKLLQLGHCLKMGQGLVGRAASSNSVVLVPDVTADPAWLPNRLLPETKSELSVPIAIGDEVLGVIDVQQNIENSLNEQDAELLISLAGQTAVALRNASLYEKARAEAMRQTMVNRIREKIFMTQSIDDALKTAVKEVGRELNLSEAAIQINPSTSLKNGHKRTDSN